MSHKLSINIVTWNSADAIGDLLDSIARQPFRDYQLICIDNASTDGTIDIIKEKAPRACLITNETNRGFAGAHNQGILLSESPYIAIVNPDILLTEDCLKILVDTLDARTDIASIGGKLLKNGASSGIIDCAGILAKSNRQFMNRGEGEADRGQYETPQEVFGLSGAFVILRREALETVRIGGEYFDEDFFAYKEDVDLAWRFLYAGWKNWYEPRAHLFHRRTAKHEAYGSIAVHGRKKSMHVKRLSYRNHLLLLAKNDRMRNWFFPLPRVVFYELAKFFYACVREPHTTLGLLDALRLLPKILKKRTITIRRARVAPRIVARWFSETWNSQSSS